MRRRSWLPPRQVLVVSSSVRWSPWSRQVHLPLTALTTWRMRGERQYTLRASVLPVFPNWRKKYLSLRASGTLDIKDNLRIRKDFKDFGTFWG